MEQGMLINKIAKELKISIQTSFDWRHKTLSFLEHFVQIELLSEVECDELELAQSNKGSKSLERKPRKRGTDFKRNQGADKITTVQLVTAVKRNGEKHLKTVASKRLSKEEIEQARLLKEERKRNRGPVVLSQAQKELAKHNQKIRESIDLAAKQRKIWFKTNFDKVTMFFENKVNEKLKKEPAPEHPQEHKEIFYQPEGLEGDMRDYQLQGLKLLKVCREKILLSY